MLSVAPGYVSGTDVVSWPRHRCASAIKATALLMHSSQMPSGKTGGLAWVAVQVRRSSRRLPSDAIAVRPSYAVETTAPRVTRRRESPLAVTLTERRGPRIHDLRSLASPVGVVGRAGILRLQPLVGRLPIGGRHAVGARAIANLSRHVVAS